MKSKFFKKAALAFVLGLLLCGAGAGVCVAEYSQLKIVKETEEATEDTFEYDLPQNESLYIKGDSDIKLQEDESVPKGKLVLKVRHGIRSTAEKNDITTETVIQHDNGKENKWQVKTLAMPDIIRTDEGESFDLSEFSDHFKKKEIFYRSDFYTEYRIYINPADKESVVRMWLHDELMLGDEYTPHPETEWDADIQEEMDEFKDDMEEMKSEMKEEIKEELKEEIEWD